MPLFGKIVVIRRDGVDGAHFPLTTGTCIFGRNADCDIRVQLPNVAKEHCRIEVDSDGNIFLVNLCPAYPTLLNQKAVTERVQVQHMDVFTVTDRSFRVEFPPGSPFRKGRSSTGSDSPVQQPTGSVKSESIPESWLRQLSTLVKEETPLRSASTTAEQSVAAKESTPSKMGIKFSPKGRTPIAKARTPIAKARTPSYSVRTPLQRGKAASPTVRSSAKSQTKAPPTGVKREAHTPLAGQRSTTSRTGNTSTVTPRSKTPSSSLVKRKSEFLADEIAELKLTLTKPKGQPLARTSALKTPGGTARRHSSTVKTKSPAEDDKVKRPSLTPRVRSSIVPTPKSRALTSVSISKTPVLTPAAKTPASIRSMGVSAKTSSVHKVKKVMTPSPRAGAQKRRSSIPSPVSKTPVLTPAAKTPASIRSWGLSAKASSVHRVKKVMTPSPRARAQKRRSSSIPSPVTEVPKKSQLRNIVPQTDSPVATQDQVKMLDSTPETSLEKDTGPFAGEKTQSGNLSPTNSLGRPNADGPNISSSAARLTRRRLHSPIIPSPGSSLTRSQSHSPRRDPGKTSPNLSPTVSLSRPNTGGPEICNPAEPLTRRRLHSPVIPSPGSALTRGKSHSPRRDPGKTSPWKMSKRNEILTKKRRSYSSSSTASNEAVKDSRPHQISSQDTDLIPSQDHTELAGSNLEPALMDTTSGKGVFSYGKSHSPELTSAESVVSRRTRSLKVSSPSEYPALVKLQDSDVETCADKRTLSPLTMSADSSLTRGKSLSPHRSPARSHSLPRGSAESSAEKLSLGVETIASSRRSSSRPSVGAKRLEAGGLNVPQAEIETVRSIVATSFAESSSSEIFSPTYQKSKSPKLTARISLSSPARSPSSLAHSKAISHLEISAGSSAQKKGLPNSQVSPVDDKADSSSSEIFSPTYQKSKSPKLTARISLSSPARSPSSLARSKAISHLEISAGSSAQKKDLQNSQVSPVNDKAKRKSQSALEFPSEASRRLSQSPATSSTRSKSQSPFRSPGEPSEDRSLHHSNNSTLDSLTRSKSQSPKESPGKTNAHGRKSQSLTISNPSENQDNTPAVTDECFLESYEQQFSPLILEMDDLDENKGSPRMTTPISGPREKGCSDPGSLKSAVGRLRRKSQPLLEELEDETFSAKSAGKPIDFDETFEDRSFVSPSQGVKRRGSPLKGLPQKRRCVSFGPDVSPELFDRSLPVATPLKRGAAPRRRSASAEQKDSEPKPLLKNRQSTLKTAAAVLLEEPLEDRSGKSPKGLRVMEKLSKGVRESPVLESTTTLNVETFTATDMEPSQPVMTPLRRQTKARRASTVEAVVSPKTLNKGRRATIGTAGVILEAPLEENPEKSPRNSKAEGKESAVLAEMNVTDNVDAEDLTSSGSGTVTSSVASSPMVGSVTGSHNRKIFTSGTGAKRLSRALKTPPATSVSTSNENSPSVKTPARKEKTPKRLQSLSPRRSHPLTNMQNSSTLHQELNDPFAFQSSPESSPAKLTTPKASGQRKAVEASASVSQELTPRQAKAESLKKKLLTKLQDDISTPKAPLDFTADRSVTSLLKGSRSAGRSSVKNVSLEQEHDLAETPKMMVTEGLKSYGRRSSKPKPVDEAVWETTPAETITSNIPRSTGRRSSRFLDKEQEEPTPVMDKSLSRRSTSSSKMSSAKATSEPVFVLEERRSLSADSAAKTPRSTGKRGQVKPEGNLKTPEAERIGESSAGSTALPAGDGIPTPRRFSGRMSSSPFKRPFGSEPRKVRLGQIDQPFRWSPEDPNRAARVKHLAGGQMISERNVDLSTLSPLKFYKSPATEALIGKRSKVTPGRAVALRALYGKSVVPPLAELQVSRKAKKSLPPVKSFGIKVTKKEKSAIQVAAKKRLERITGFDVKKKQTRVLLLKKVGRKSVGQVAKRVLPGRRQKRRRRAKPGSIQEGRNSMPIMAENVLEVLSEKDQALAELSKSSSSYSVLLTPKGPGEMSISPWSSPVPSSSGKRKSSGRTAVADDTPEGRRSSSFAGLKRMLTSPTEGISPNLSGVNMHDEVESSPQVFGVKQLATTPKIENSPQLSGVRKLVKTPKVQKSPQLSGVRKLVKTPKVQKSPQLSGVRELVKTPAVQKSPKLSGVRELVKTPKVQKSPKLSGVRNFMKTPRVQKSPQLSGVRKLVKTPEMQKSPKLSGVRELVKTPKVKKSPQLSGVRKLVKTPNVQKSPKLSGVRNLVKTPKVQKSPKLSGVRNLVKTPKVQKSPKLSGVRNLVKTPKVQKSPKLSGVRNLVKTPRVQKSPQLSGVRNLVKTPRVQKSPQLSGVRKLVKTPKVQKSPNLTGVRNLVKTPKTQKSPKLSGLKELLKTPNVKKSPQLSGVKNVTHTHEFQESPDLTGVKTLVKSPRQLQTPQLHEMKDLVSTPKVLSPPKVGRLSELVQSPATRRSLQRSGHKMAKTPKTQKSTKLEGVRKSQKTPKLGRSPALGGVKALVKTPKMQPTPKLGGLRNLMLTPKAILSPELEGVHELFQSPLVPRSAKKTPAKTPIKSAKVNESSHIGAKLSSTKATAVKRIARKAESAGKSPKSPVTPILAELKDPLEDTTPVRSVIRPRKLAGLTGVEKVKDITQLPSENVHDDENVGMGGKAAAAKSRKRTMAESAEKPAAKKRRVATETEDSTKYDGGELHGSVKKGRGSKKVATEPLARTSEIEVTASESNAEGCLHIENGAESSALQHDKLQVMSTAASPKMTGGRNSRSRKSKTMEVEEVTIEENVPATVEETVKGGAISAAPSPKLARGRNSRSRKGKISEVEEVTIEENVPATVEETVKGGAISAAPSPKQARGKNSRSRKGKTTEVEEVTIEENVPATVEETVKGGAISGAPSPKLARGRNSRSRKGKTTEVEEVTIEENVPATVEETVKGGAISAAPSPKLARGKNSRSRKGKTTEVEEVTIEENVPAAVERTMKRGAKRNATSSKKDLPEELAVESEDKAKSKARTKGKGKATQAEKEVLVQEIGAGDAEVLIPPATEKSNGRQQSRVRKDTTKEVVHAEAVVNKVEGKSKTRGKTIAAKMEAAPHEQVTLEETVASSVAVKVVNRRQGRAAQRDASEELNVVQSEAVAIVPERKGRAREQGKTRQAEVEVNDTSFKGAGKLGSRRQVRSLKGLSEEVNVQTESVVNKTGRKGKSKTQSGEAVEENLENTVVPRNKKQKTQEDAVDSNAVNDDADETGKVKRPARGRKTKSDGAEGKGKTVLSEEAALVVDSQTTCVPLNKTENAVVVSGKRGRKDKVVEPDVEVITDGARSSRKRQAKSVEDIAPGKAKKARISIEDTALEAAKAASSPKQRGLKKVNKKDGNNLAAKKLSTAENEPTEIPQVSSTTDEEIKASSLGTKPGRSSSKKAKSAESSEAPKRTDKKASRQQKTIEQTASGVDHAVELKPKGRQQKVKFDVPPTPIDALKKAEQSPARGRRGASKRGSEDKTASKDLQASMPKSRVSRGVSSPKDSAPPSGKRAQRASKK